MDKLNELLNDKGLTIDQALSCCRHCTERKVGCHSWCESGILADTIRKLLKEEEWKKNEPKRVSSDYHKNSFSYKKYVAKKKKGG